MENKKVYLAKSNLASATDVEYVKSHLMRIPNIRLVEFADGIPTYDCAALVVITEANADLSQGELVIGKGVATAIQDYLDNADNPEYIFIYAGASVETAKSINDKEPNSPACYPFFDLSEIDTSDYVNYAEMSFDASSEGVSLLSEVSDAIEINFSDWCDTLATPRFWEPPTEYAMPNIPSIEDRKLRKNGARREASATSSAKSNTGNLSKNSNVGAKVRTSNSGQRLLIRAFRKK